MSALRGPSQLVTDRGPQWGTCVGYMYSAVTWRPGWDENVEGEEDNCPVSGQRRRRWAEAPKRDNAYHTEREETAQLRHSPTLTSLHFFRRLLVGGNAEKRALGYRYPANSRCWKDCVRELLYTLDEEEFFMGGFGRVGVSSNGKLE